MRSWLRWCLLAALATVLLGVTVVVRSLRDGSLQMELSDAAFHRGNVWEATVHARRAAMAYVPMAQHPELAFARLRAVASGAEARGEWRLAQMAYRAIREAALETQYFYAPRSEELAVANSKLALLQVLNDGSPAELRDTRYNAALKQLKEPQPAAWSGLLVLLVLGVAVGVVVKFGLSGEATRAGDVPGVL